MRPVGLEPGRSVLTRRSLLRACAAGVAGLGLERLGGATAFANDCSGMFCPQLYLGYWTDGLHHCTGMRCPVGYPPLFKAMTFSDDPSNDLGCYAPCRYCIPVPPHKYLPVPGKNPPFASAAGFAKPDKKKMKDHVFHKPDLIWAGKPILDWNPKSFHVGPKDVVREEDLFVEFTDPDDIRKHYTAWLIRLKVIPTWCQPIPPPVWAGFGRQVNPRTLPGGTGLLRMDVEEKDGKYFQLRRVDPIVAYNYEYYHVLVHHPE
jgi:hypothetical protein